MTPLDLTTIEVTARDSFPGAVLAGDPVLSTCTVWASADGLKSRGVFEATPGTFTWTFGWHEFFVVIAGRAIVETADGTFTLTPGMVGSFAPGDETRWTIEETFRKTFDEEPASAEGALS